MSKSCWKVLGTIMIARDEDFSPLATIDTLFEVSTFLLKEAVLLKLAGAVGCLAFVTGGFVVDIFFAFAIDSLILFSKEESSLRRPKIISFNFVLSKRSKSFATSILAIEEVVDSI